MCVLVFCVSHATVPPIPDIRRSAVISDNLRWNPTRLDKSERNKRAPAYWSFSVYAFDSNDNVTIAQDLMF